MRTDVLTVINRQRPGLMPRDFWGLFLMPFIVGATSLTYMEGISTLIVLYGVLLAGCFVLYFLYNRLETPPEVLIYMVWIIWSLGGLTNVTNRELYFGQLRTVIQIGALMFVISGIVAMRKELSTIMMAIGVGGAIVGASAAFDGELANIMAGAEWQLKGLPNNPNEFAYCILFVVIASLFFLRGRPSRRERVFLLGTVVLSVVLLIMSGSRKSFLAVLVFFFLRWVFCSEKRLSRNMIWGYLIVVFFLAGAYILADYVVHSTYLGQRLQDYNDSGNRLRIQMYREGLEMIRRHPIFGVGLDNYRALSSSGLYSHSDYVEVASNTGIVGAAIYFSVYLVLWTRLRRLSRIRGGADYNYTIALLKAVVLVILLLAFARPNINSKLTWIFVAAASGYSWGIERGLTDLRRRMVRVKPL